MKKHSPWWWIVNSFWVIWLLFGVFFLKSCDGRRDYRIHPTTDDDIEAQELIHSR